MAGVARRDGLREALTRTLAEQAEAIERRARALWNLRFHDWRGYPWQDGNGPPSPFRSWAHEQAYLDAVPDVPPDKLAATRDGLREAVSLRARLERERDVLERLAHHPCPCPRDTPVPEVAAVDAIIDHLARVLDAVPDVPPDPPAAEHKHLSCETCRFNMAKAYREGRASVAAEREGDGSDG